MDAPKRSPRQRRNTEGFPHGLHCGGDAGGCHPRDGAPVTIQPLHVAGAAFFRRHQIHRGGNGRVRIRARAWRVRVHRVAEDCWDAHGVTTVTTSRLFRVGRSAGVAMRRAVPALTLRGAAPSAPSRRGLMASTHDVTQAAQRRWMNMPQAHTSRTQTRRRSQTEHFRRCETVVKWCPGLQREFSSERV